MQTKAFSNILIILVILFFSSCAKLPVYKSNPFIESEKEKLLNPSTGNYDEKTNIQIEVANSDTTLYIRAIFHDKENYKSIMRGGLTVFFDPQGKKKKLNQLKIEKGDTQVTEYALLSRQMESGSGNQQQNIITSIDILYNKITWDKNGKQIVFYRNLQNKPISVQFEANKQNELLLDIEIPLKEIQLTAGQNLFSLGIESGNLPSQNMSGQRPSAGMSGRGGQGGGAGRGGGGGGRPGGGKSGGGGGKSGGGSRPAGQSNGMDPVKIWTQVELKM